MLLRFISVLATAVLLLPATLIVLVRRRRTEGLQNFNFAEAKSRER